MRRLATIGVASVLGANLVGSEHGPSILMRSKSFKQEMLKHDIHLQWRFIRPRITDNTFDDVKGLVKKIRRQVRDTVSKGTPFVVIGGDHSMAMGVWQGAMSALQPKRLGLIWIDWVILW